MREKVVSESQVSGKKRYEEMRNEGGTRNEE